MNNIVTKELVKKLLSLPGHSKGTIILANLEFLKKRGGDEAFLQLKNKIKELEIPVNLEEVKHRSVHPEGISVLIVLLITEILNLDESGVFEMGRAGMKLSPIVKILTDFFASIDTILEKAPRYWKKYFDFGELKIVEHNKEKKYAIIRLKGYNFHPLACVYHAGYFYQVAKIATDAEHITIKETKCTFRGDPFDEFYLSWNNETK